MFSVSGFVDPCICSSPGLAVLDVLLLVDCLLECTDVAGTE